MKKTLLICAMTMCVAACTEQRHEEYAMGYAYVPAYTGCGCNSCAQPAPTCNTCFQPVQPVLHQQPKTIVVMVPPAPQPVVEHEIVYQPQPECGCKKCGCPKAQKQGK